jgi:glycosyltransferase involved in cell wall biosynthesis
MRIAQVSPLCESVPPRMYGGTERVVHNLVEELVRRGHDVTLFASGDSRTSARLVPITPTALRMADRVRDPLAHHLCLLDEVFGGANEFDIIHCHVDYLAFPFIERCPTPALSTLHGRLDLPDLPPVYRRFSSTPVVSISAAQRAPLSWANWLGTIHHGLPDGPLRFQPRAGDYLAFLGRISPEKRVDRAIEIARRVGLPLKIAAKVDPLDRDYYQQVRPLMDDPLVEFIGEIQESDKSAFLGGALALLFPIDWPEPFGLVMIEAMACGTPVVAFRGGAVDEVMKDGVSGFVVDDLDGAVAALGRIPELDRMACRAYFDSRFRVERMAEAYLDVYAQLLAAPIAASNVA